MVTQSHIGTVKCNRTSFIDVQFIEITAIKFIVHLLHRCVRHVVVPFIEKLFSCLCMCHRYLSKLNISPVDNTGSHEIQFDYRYIKEMAYSMNERLRKKWKCLLDYRLKWSHSVKCNEKLIIYTAWWQWQCKWGDDRLFSFLLLFFQLYRLNKLITNVLKRHLTEGLKTHQKTHQNQYENLFLCISMCFLLYRCVVCVIYARLQCPHLLDKRTQMEMDKNIQVQDDRNKSDIVFGLTFGIFGFDLFFWFS